MSNSEWNSSWCSKHQPSDLSWFICRFDKRSRPRCFFCGRAPVKRKRKSTVIIEKKEPEKAKKLNKIKYLKKGEKCMCCPQYISWFICTWKKLWGILYETCHAEKQDKLCHLFFKIVFVWKLPEQRQSNVHAASWYNAWVLCFRVVLRCRGHL